MGLYISSKFTLMLSFFFSGRKKVDWLTDWRYREAVLQHTYVDMCPYSYVGKDVVATSTRNSDGTEAW